MRDCCLVWKKWPQFFRGAARLTYQLHRSVTIERTIDERVYFTDASGTRWRVHDVSYGSPHALPYHYKRFTVGDPRATSRMFVSAAGNRLVPVCEG
jgi:hypothetical protein